MLDKIYRRYLLEPRQRRQHQIWNNRWTKELKFEALDLSKSRLGALNWLLEAQNNPSHEGKGFDRAFNLLTKSWELPYPETSGYIVPTLLESDHCAPSMGLKEKALAAGKWLESTQFQSGAICSKQWFVGNTKPSVFNTGMVLHGFTALSAHTKDEQFATSAMKAARWLIDAQSKNGAWVKYSFNDLDHTYYTMVAWALIAFGLHFNDEEAIECAKKNLKWTMGEQQLNGWVKKVDFMHQSSATTHTIAYCAQGLAESGRLLNETQYLHAAIRLIEPLNQSFADFGFLPGAFDDEWRPMRMSHKNGLNRTVLKEYWECLTGTSQSSCTNFCLYEAAGDSKFLDSGRMMNRHLRSRQLNHVNPYISGGFSGSWPLHGPYDTFCLPNHAAKFFIDALNMEEKSTL